MKKLILFALILSPLLRLTGQTMGKAELKEYFLDAEFFFAQEEYNDALYDYMELYNNGYAENANINYRIGICYLNIAGQKDKSIAYLNRAVTNTSRKYRNGAFKETRSPVDAWLFLGNAYRINNQLDKAIETYNHYKSLTRSSDEIKYADQQIEACQTAIKFMSDPVSIRRTNLGTPINTSSSNFKAVLSGNGKKLAYMNELPFYDAVYFSTFEQGSWTEPINITPQIQSDGDQYVSSLSYDGTTLYLTREGTFDSDIMVSRFENDMWTKSVPVGGNINTKYWESHASVSRDGKTLYFTSNRKGGPGSMDIFKTTKNDLGLWSEPVPLGNEINTLLNEDTPFITENDSLLYFSSQGHVTMGGYDIHRSRLNASGTWSVPENLKYPVNTTDDDLFYYPWLNGTIGYVSLFEKEGLGKEDIYALQPFDDKPFNEVLADYIRAGEKVTVKDLVAVTEKETEPTETAEPVQAETVAEKPVEKPLPVEEAEAEAETIQAPGKQEPAVVPEATVKEVTLNPVYFAFDNSQLSETGKNELKKVAALLQEIPGSQLKLLGYADPIGPAPYNLTLSEKRAVSAMKFLVSLGIEAGRMSATGLGETHFAAINTNPDGTDNPEGRRLNRRVEFEIIATDAGHLLIRRPVIPENLRYKGN